MSYNLLNWGHTHAHTHRYIYIYIIIDYIHICIYDYLLYIYIHTYTYTQSTSHIKKRVGAVSAKNCPSARAAPESSYPGAETHPLLSLKPPLLDSPQALAWPQGAAQGGLFSDPELLAASTVILFLIEHVYEHIYVYYFSLSLSCIPKVQLRLPKQKEPQHWAGLYKHIIGIHMNKHTYIYIYMQI